MQHKLTIRVVHPLAALRVQSSCHGLKHCSHADFVQFSIAIYQLWWCEAIHVTRGYHNYGSEGVTLMQCLFASMDMHISYIFSMKTKAFWFLLSGYMSLSILCDLYLHTVDVTLHCCGIFTAQSPSEVFFPLIDTDAVRITDVHTAYWHVGMIKMTW